MNKLKNPLYQIIFEADTPAGKAFDISLLWVIVLSILVTILETIPNLSPLQKQFLIYLEWIFTVLFSVEYLLRMYSSPKPVLYMRSAMGIVDLLALLPTYLSLFFAGSSYFVVLRAMRLLRVFRILKLNRYVSESRVLMQALKMSIPKILVFLGSVVTLVIILGTIMYMVEGPEHGFTSIPISIYWAIVTLTTVGFGDIVPKTPFGQIIASAVMILGYGILAVPTGIVTVELAEVQKTKVTTQLCPSCFREGHDTDAKFCKYCGAELNPDPGANTT